MSSSSECVGRIKCKLDDDPRLIAGASAIVAHVARRAGLSDRAAKEIAGAASTACDAAFRALAGAGASAAAMTLSAAEFPDRMEVSIEPAREGLKALRASSTSGRSAEFERTIRESLKSAVVDGVDIELRDGIPRVTLVKNSGNAKRRFMF